MSEDKYNELKSRLKSKAKEIGRLVGFSNYDVDGAEKDFVGYFEEYGYNKIKIFDSFLKKDIAEISYTKYFEKFKESLEKMADENNGHGITGQCNPYSPVVIAASEYAHDIQNYLSAYFPFFYDLLWINFFKIFNSTCIEKYLIEKLFDSFYESMSLYWACLKDDDTHKEYLNPLDYPFYKYLRQSMDLMEYKFKFNYPFMVYNTLYYIKQDGGHQWSKIDKIKQFLLYCYDIEKTYSSDDNSFFNDYNLEFKKNNIQKFEEYPGKYIPFEEYFFLTECNIRPSKTTSGNIGMENKFLEYMVNNFKTPRIIILNPTVTPVDKTPDWYKKYIPQNKKNFFVFRWGNGPQQKRNIEISSYFNGYCNHIIIKTPNLTGNSKLPNSFYFFLANKIKEIGGIYYE